MVQGVEIVSRSDGSSAIVDRSPLTNEILAHVPCSSAADVDTSVQAASVAQEEWGLIPLHDRVQILKDALAQALAHAAEADVVERFAKDSCTTAGDGDLAALITHEMGKVLSEAQGEVAEMGSCFLGDGVPGGLDLIAEANQPEILAGETTKSTIFRDPVGVVAVIAPWNYPVFEIVALVLPALAAGNSVVVKPSEVTPLAGAAIVSFLQAGLPPNTLNLVQGDGSVGSLLVAHKDVHLVAMTGSSATGKKIMQECGKSLKPLVLELGGKDPMVVFADADLAKAAKDAVHGACMNAGQVCSSVERVYVEGSVMAQFEQLCKTEVAKWGAGSGFDDKIKIGPMVSWMQRELVERHVKDALAKGARIVGEGTLVDQAEDDDSTEPGGVSADDGAGAMNNIPVKSKTNNFFPATVLSDVSPDMLIAREETFGPVLPILSFDGTELQAVRFANDSEYGLAASVYSNDVAKATRVAGRIRAGQVAVNSIAGVNADVPGKCPWVGVKGSGFSAPNGMDGWRQFSVPKSVIGF